MTQFWQVLGADAAARALLALALVALIRFMPVEEYAALTFAVALATLVAQVLAAGFNRVYILAFAALRLEERTEAFLGAQLALFAALAAATAPLALTLGGAYPWALALAAGVLLAEFAKTGYQRNLAFGGYSGVELGRALAQAVGIAALIALAGSGLGAAPVLAVQAAALFGVSAVALGTRLRWARVLDLGAAAALLREVLAGRHAVLLAYFALIALFSQVDVLMLKALAGEQQLASYGAAYRYYSLLLLALGAAHTVLLPAVERAESAAALEQLFREHLRRVAVFTPAVLAAAWACAWVLPWIDEGRYPDSVPAFRILCVSALISFSCSPHVSVLMKRERFRFLLQLALGAFAVACALHLLLIPRAGAIGAAWATLAASACVTVPVFLYARRLRGAAT